MAAQEPSSVVESTPPLEMTSMGLYIVVGSRLWSWDEIRDDLDSAWLRWHDSRVVVIVVLGSGRPVP